MGTCSTVARFGGILSLIIQAGGTVWPPFPMVIMGSVATVAGIVALFFPETIGEKLPETMEDAINVGKNARKNLFTCNYIGFSED